MPEPDQYTETIIVGSDINRANALAAELGLTVSDGYRFMWARKVGTPLVFKRVAAHEMEKL
jgi:hypothetical protein